MSNDVLFVLAMGIVAILMMITLARLYAWKDSISYQVDAIDNRQDVEADYLTKLEKEVEKLKGK